MSPLQFIGILGLATGAGLLLSEPILGQYLLAKLTGIQIVSLRIMCGIIVAFGALALALSKQEKQSDEQYEKIKTERNQSR